MIALLSYSACVHDWLMAGVFVLHTESSLLSWALVIFKLAAQTRNANLIPGVALWSSRSLSPTHSVCLYSIMAPQEEFYYVNVGVHRSHRRVYRNSFCGGSQPCTWTRWIRFDRLRPSRRGRVDWIWWRWEQVNWVLPTVHNDLTLWRVVGMLDR